MTFCTTLPLADSVATGMGSWRFIIYQTLIVALWMILNVILIVTHRWDPYPYILLNLVFFHPGSLRGPNNNDGSKPPRMKGTGSTGK